MSILIIGNGFDLAHKLPTQYSDFLGFIKAYKDADTSLYSGTIPELKDNGSILSQEMNQLIDSNILLEYFLAVYEERCKAGRNGWIDFESEISQIIQKLDEAKQEVEQKYSKTGQPVPLEKGIAAFLKPIIQTSTKKVPNTIIGESSYEPRFFDYQAKRILESLNKLIRLLEIYLYEYVEKIDCRFRLPDIKSQNIDMVISFNYTGTYRKYYDPEGKAKYCYIHGKTQNSNLDDCNMVLGIDEYLQDSRVDLDNQFVWFKKFYQRIYKQTDSTYLDWINHFESFNETYKKGKPSHMDLYIYGHSLDVTDKDVLSRLILMDNTTTYIFYHNREAMAKQISNLVKVIGKENLVRMTGGNDRSIRFIQSKPAVEV